MMSISSTMDFQLFCVPLIYNCNQGCTRLILWKSYISLETLPTISITLINLPSTPVFFSPINSTSFHSINSDAYNTTPERVVIPEDTRLPMIEAHVVEKFLMKQKRTAPVQMKYLIGYGGIMPHT